MIALDARAYRSDEEFGHDRWCASQITCGRGTHEAIVLVFKDVTEKACYLDEHNVVLDTRWDVKP